MKWNKDVNIRDACFWLPDKIKLIELKDKLNSENKNIEVFRGEIYNIDLGKGNLGSETNKLRPCLIISNQNLNKGQTVVVVPLTTKFKSILGTNGEIMPKYKNNFILFKSRYNFLREDSCIKLEDIRCIDKVRIKEKLGEIKPDDLKALKNKIMFTMGF